VQNIDFHFVGKANTALFTTVSQFVTDFIIQGVYGCANRKMLSSTIFFGCDLFKTKQMIKCLAM